MVDRWPLVANGHQGVMATGERGLWMKQRWRERAVGAHINSD